MGILSVSGRVSNKCFIKVLLFVLVFHPMGRLMFGFDKIGIVRKILSLMYIY